MRKIKAVCWSRFNRHQHWRILSKLFDMNTSQWLNHGESLNSLFLLTESNTHSFSILNHGTGVYNLCRRENCLLPKGIIIGIIGIIIISPHHHCHIVVMRQNVQPNHTTVLLLLFVELTMNSSVATCFCCLFFNLRFMNPTNDESTSHLLDFFEMPCAPVVRYPQRPVNKVGSHRWSSMS